MLEDGSTLAYLGKNYQLKIIQRNGDDEIKFVGGKFLVYLSMSVEKAKRIRSLYEDWLTLRARNIFKSKVRKYSDRLNIKGKTNTI